MGVTKAVPSLLARLTQGRTCWHGVEVPRLQALGERRNLLDDGHRAAPPVEFDRKQRNG
jgi:hypothetical protein